MIALSTEEATSSVSECDGTLGIMVTEKDPSAKANT